MSVANWGIVTRFLWNFIRETIMKHCPAVHFWLTSEKQNIPGSSHAVLRASSTAGFKYLSKETLYRRIQHMFHVQYIFLRVLLLYCFQTTFRNGRLCSRFRTRVLNSSELMNIHVCYPLMWNTEQSLTSKSAIPVVFIRTWGNNSIRI